MIAAMDDIFFRMLFVMATKCSYMVVAGVAEMIDGSMP